MDARESRPILDDAERILQIDTKGMLRQITEFPEQCETALGIARSYQHEAPDFEPSLVYFSGIGVSQLAAAVAIEACRDQARIPVICERGEALPAFIGETSLVVLVSYQGTSQLTIRNYREALARKARVVCITVGGDLSDMALENDTRVIRVPSGQTARAAVGYMIGQALGVLAQYKVITSADDVLFAAAKLLKAERELLRVEFPSERNRAKLAAQFLFNRIPAILSAPDYREMVARRLRNQLGINSKRPALARGIFEAVAGEISAWEMPGSTNAEFCFILLTDPADSESEIASTMDRVEQVLAERYSVLRLESRGRTAAEKLMSGFLIADYISFYLAMLYGVDPTRTAYSNAMTSEFTAPVEDSAAEIEEPGVEGPDNECAC